MNNKIKSKYLFLSIIILISPFLIINIVLAQDSLKTVKWLPLNQAIELSKQNKKNIFIDFYTDWCGWCKKMTTITFENPNVVELLNKNYYPVKFNGEYKDTIVFKGQAYINPNPKGFRSPNQLTLKLLNGRLVFPSIVFLDENQNIIFQRSGYIPPEEMEIILKYINNAYKTQNYEDYRALFINNKTHN
jgi:thioredoxin-related protein